MIYFDAGATTLEKPAAVGQAMARAAHTMSSPGRGSYPLPAWPGRRPICAARRRRSCWGFPSRKTSSSPEAPPMA